MLTLAPLKTLPVFAQTSYCSCHFRKRLWRFTSVSLVALSWLPRCSEFNIRTFRGQFNFVKEPEVTSAIAGEQGGQELTTMLPQACLCLEWHMTAAFAMFLLGWFVCLFVCFCGSQCQVMTDFETY